MGLLADDARFDRRSGLRALLILLLVLALGFAAAWMTLGRHARFQSLKGVFLSFDVPRTFIEVDEEGSGESITSLGQPGRLERTYASPLAARGACRELGRSFDRGNVEIGPVPAEGAGVECSFRGRVGRFSFGADVRRIDDFLAHATAEALDLPTLPEGTRAVTIMTARG